MSPPCRQSILSVITKLTLLAVLFAIPAGAEGLQQQSTVTGTVRDGSTGEPLAGVAVQVVGLAIGTFTNEDGRYVIQTPRKPGSSSAGSGMLHWSSRSMDGRPSTSR